MIDPMTIPPSSPGSEATAGPKLPSAVCFKGPQTKSRMPGWPLPASQCLFLCDSLIDTRQTFFSTHTAKSSKQFKI